MFLRKLVQIGLSNIKKLVDFKMLNSYPSVWKTHFIGTLLTVCGVPEEWVWFSVLDLSREYFHVLVRSSLWGIFCFD